MKITAFEQELKELDADLSIMVAPANPEMSGIYWRGIYITGVPSNDIFDEPRADYKNSAGHIHKTRPTALAQVKDYLERVNNDAEFREAELADAKM